MRTHTQRPDKCVCLSIYLVFVHIWIMYSTHFSIAQFVLFMCADQSYIYWIQIMYIYLDQSCTHNRTDTVSIPPTESVCQSGCVRHTHTHVCLYRLTMIFLYSGRERERNTLTGTYFQRPLHSGIDRLHGAGRSSNRRCSDA